MDKERISFCSLLGVPYYVVVVASNTRRFRVHECKLTDTGVEYRVLDDLSENSFAEWWRTRQSFDQVKGMYDANRRIADSIIDKVLFQNHLSWGVNVDGFMLTRNKNRVLGIFEKRIRTRKGIYGVDTYDPNRYFMGTANRGGDYNSWSILHALATRLGCGLFLMTFDDGPGTRRMGIAIIKRVSARGLVYSQEGPPTQNILCEPDECKNWLKKRLI